MNAITNKIGLCAEDIDAITVGTIQQSIRIPRVPDRYERKPNGTLFNKREKDIEEDLNALVEQICPGVRVVGEESRSRFRRCGYCDKRNTSIHDPVDGTALRAKGVNLYGTSVAFFDGAARPVLAVFSQPFLNCYVARVEGGRLRAWKDGREIVPRTTDVDIKDAYCYIGSDAHQRLTLETMPCKIRALGATAAHLSMLACDALGDPVAVALTRYKRWDAAAGLIFAQATDKEIYSLTTGIETTFDAVYKDGTDDLPLLVATKPFGRLLAPHLKLRRITAKHQRA